MLDLLGMTGVKACKECGERAMAERDRLEAENARLRTAVATAIRVQTVLCGDWGMPRCRAECPLYRLETDDCMACDVTRAAHELGIEVEE